MHQKKRQRYASTASSKGSSIDQNNQAASSSSVRETAICNLATIREVLPIPVIDEIDADITSPTNAAYIRPRVTNPTEHIFEALDIPCSVENGISGPLLSDILPLRPHPSSLDQSSLNYNPIAHQSPHESLHSTHDSDKKDNDDARSDINTHSDDEKCDQFIEDTDDEDTALLKKTSVVVSCMHLIERKQFIDVNNNILFPLLSILPYLFGISSRQ